MRTAAAVLLLLCALPAQRETSLQATRIANQTAGWCRELADPARRPAAQRWLWRGGAAVVPALLDVVRQGDERTPAALAVLAALRGEARAAHAELLRLAAGGSACAAAAAHAAACIGAADAILLADFGNGAVVELDGAGRERRRVACRGAWAAAPLAGDRLLVCNYQRNEVVEMDWAGQVHRALAVPNGPLRAVRDVGGDTLVACWDADLVLCLDAAGNERWRAGGVDATDLEPDWDASVLVVDRERQRLVRIVAGQQPQQVQALGEGPMDVDLLPNGELLLTSDLFHCVSVVDAAGEVRRELDLDGEQPEDAERLRDGRTLVAGGHGVAMYAASGARLWQWQGGQVGSVFVRVAPPAK